MSKSNGCALCGATKASGWAWINDDRYCHSDSIIASCYQEAMWAMEAGVAGDWLDWLEEVDPMADKRKEEWK